MKIYVINGPNLDRLGQRDREVYGSFTLKDIQDLLIESFSKHRNDKDTVDFVFIQSNSELEIIESLWRANDEKADGIVLNAAAYSHYSIAIRDAVEAIQPILIEVHISNIYAREDFRQHSVISSVASGVIVGLGSFSYIHAVNAILFYDTQKKWEKQKNK